MVPAPKIVAVWFEAIAEAQYASATQRFSTSISQVVGSQLLERDCANWLSSHSPTPQSTLYQSLQFSQTQFSTGTTKGTIGVGLVVWGLIAGTLETAVIL